jgi:DNA-binding transcriptional MerR regulator
MRISELSRHANVPTTTIKFYIREGLLPAGERSHRNQASYGEDHLQRLDLIRALRDVAALPLEVVREVLTQVDQPWGASDPVGAALGAIYRVPARQRSAAEQEEYDRVRDEAEALMRGRAWSVPGDLLPDAHLYLDNLADAVVQIRRYIDPEFSVDALEPWADAMWRFTDLMFAPFEDAPPRPGDDLVSPTRSAVLGTLLTEPVVTALLRGATASRSVRISQDLPLPPETA